jgi:hypothetical protein
MIEPTNLLNLAWALTTLLEGILLVLIVRRRLSYSHPAFSLYIVAVILQSGAVAWSSWNWGPRSIQHFNIVWGSQALVVCARWLAITEITRKILAGYSGIWRMASRILFFLGAIVLIYSIAVSTNRWELMVLNADRAVELCIAAFVVGMLLFARYYRLAMGNLERQLTIGFCLYSCSWVINVSIFQSWRDSMGLWWDFFGVLSYFATLAIWIDGARKTVTIRAPVVPSMLSRDTYRKLVQQLNTRLDALNRRLSHLFRSRSEDPHS